MGHEICTGNQAESCKRDAAKKPFLGNASVVMPQDHPHKHFVVHYMYKYSKLVILIVDIGCVTIL